MEDNGNLDFEEGYPVDDGSLDSRGSLSSFQVGREFDYVLHEHDAKRAGLHYDLRIGDPQTGLLSWAIPKARLPETPGKSVLAVRQPLHRYNYGSFEGVIPQGRGAGSVAIADKGRAVITEKGPNYLRFALLHQRYPSEYMLVRKGKDVWFLVNVTPTESDAELYPKEHYGVVENPEDYVKPGRVVSPKIDGAAILLRLLKDRAEVSSIRNRVEGGPIRHTWKLEGLGGLRTPPELRDMVLRGELYGKRRGRAIPAAEVGGLLNTDTLRSRERQRQKGIQLLIALYGIASAGKHKLPETREEVQEIFNKIEKLTGGVAHPLKEAYTTEDALKLIRQIREGRHPLTSEGVVFFEKGKKPVKSVFNVEGDVYIREIFPAVTKDGSVRAGGFAYSLTPDGPIVGRVGSGFTREDAEDMIQHPEEWVGRKARVRAHSQLPSGAYRMPIFWARHEG